MSPTEPPRFRAEWLDLREPADGAARAAELLDPLLRRLGLDARWDGHQRETAPVVVCDLGGGTGAMGRWLAPRLPGPQRWVVFDRDATLLARAATGMTTLAAADGAPVTVTTRHADLATLSTADLAGAGLVTASALLDVLGERDVEQLATACVDAACPVLLTLTVTGQVELDPPDPLDSEIVTAFNAHQRRPTAGRPLLGPDAAGATAEAFTRRGAAVDVRPSPWLLGPDRSALLSRWLRGWVAAAYQHRPDLPAARYLRQRLAEAADGQLRAVIGHRDLLVL
jgi:hypothetical protein